MVRFKYDRVSYLHQPNTHQALNIRVAEAEDFTYLQDNPFVSAWTGLNVKKAGFDDVDKEKASKIIINHTKDSPFYKDECKRYIRYKNKSYEIKAKITNATDKEIQKNVKVMNSLLQKIKSESENRMEVVHIDMDMFFAACEERENPSLIDTIFAVGSSNMLLTSNYHARKYGIRGGMPGFIGNALAQEIAGVELTIVEPNMTLYKKLSSDVQHICQQYDQNFTMKGLDEGYLNLKHHLIHRPSLTKYEKSVVTEKCGACKDKIISDCSDCSRILYGDDIESAVRQMRETVYQSTGLTCSAGIGHNNLIAKLCTDINKPNGQYKMDESESLDYVRALRVISIPGIGKKLDSILSMAFDIHTVNELYEKRHMLPFGFLEATLLRLGGAMMAEATTEGYRKTVKTKYEGRPVIAAETKFVPTSSRYDILMELQSVTEDISKQLLNQNQKAQTINIKVKSNKSDTLSASKTVKQPIQLKEDVLQISKDLLFDICKNHNTKISYISISLTDFV